LLRNLASSLFEHKRISTTEAKARELRPYAEKLITKAKNALLKEKQGLLPQGQTIDIHNRRIVYKDIRNKAVVQELFDTIAPLVEERPGGYTRIVKTGIRRGDSGRTAIIELVDWAAPQDGAVSFKSKKKSKARKQKTKSSKIAEQVKDDIKEADNDETSETQVQETQEITEEVKGQTKKQIEDKEIDTKTTQDPEKGISAEKNESEDATVIEETKDEKESEEEKKKESVEIAEKSEENEEVHKDKAIEETKDEKSDNIDKE